MTTTLTPQSGEPMDRRTEVHVVSRVARGCRIGLNVWPVPRWKNTCHESSNRRYPDVLPFCSRKTCFWTHFFWKKMIPSGYVKHSYWKWPSRNSGVFPLKNGGSFHSFLIFLLTFTRGSSPTLCIGFWGYLSWRCLPNSSHICTLTKTGFIHVPSRQGRGFTDPWYFVGKSHGKCPSHLTRQHFFFPPGFKNEESYYLLLYPLVNVHITGKTPLFLWPFSIANC